MYYRDGSKFTAKLVDGQGNPRSGENIQFNINGVLYNRETDVDGMAKLNINLVQGKYIITSMFGDSVVSNILTIRD